MTTSQRLRLYEPPQTYSLPSLGRFALSVPRRRKPLGWRTRGESVQGDRTQQVPSHAAALVDGLAHEALERF